MVTVFRYQKRPKRGPLMRGSGNMLPWKNVLDFNPLKSHSLAFRVFRTGYWPGFKIKARKIYLHLEKVIHFSKWNFWNVKQRKTVCIRACKGQHFKTRWTTRTKVSLEKRPPLTSVNCTIRSDVSCEPEKTWNWLRCRFHAVLLRFKKRMMWVTIHRNTQWAGCNYRKPNTVLFTRQLIAS